MKQYAIDVDFLVTKRIFVDAENEEQAELIAKQRCDENPYQFTNNPDACIDYSITDVNECEKEDADPDGLAYSQTMREAIQYVTDNMDYTEIDIIRAQVDRNFNRHLNPSHGIDDSKIIDLLEEYGDNNELPEGWWMEECEMDDIVLLL